MQDAVFLATGGVIILCSFLVMNTKNIFRAALLLVVSFLGVAALFITLRAEFLGVIQILVYVGAIAILIIFGIMMTRDSHQGNLPARNSLFGAFVGIAVAVLIGITAVNTDWVLIQSDSLPQLEYITSNSPQVIGELMLNEFILPFEIVSVVLLAAIIGALAVVRD